MKQKINDNQADFKCSKEMRLSNEYLPPFEECDVDDGGVVVDKLEGEQFEGDTVVVLLLGTQALHVSQPESKPVVDLQSNIVYNHQNYLNKCSAITIIVSTSNLIFIQSTDLVTLKAKYELKLKAIPL